jgi:hypothetical protein
LRLLAAVAPGIDPADSRSVQMGTDALHLGVDHAAVFARGKVRRNLRPEGLHRLPGASADISQRVHLGWERSLHPLLIQQLTI